MNRGREQEHYVDRVGKRLLIPRIAWAIRIERPAIIASLNFACDLWTVGIAMMEQQLACPEPAWIEIGEIPSRAIVTRGSRLLIRDQHMLDVEPHAGRHHQRGK
jgi:hypothetical protein